MFCPICNVECATTTSITLKLTNTNLFLLEIDGQPIGHYRNPDEAFKEARRLIHYHHERATWPKRYCLWRVSNCGQSNYEYWFDTLAECRAFRNQHLSEEIEYQDAKREGGNAGRGIWFYSIGERA